MDESAPPRAATAAEAAEMINRAIVVAGNVQLQTAMIAMSALIGHSIGQVATSSDHARLLAAIIHENVINQATLALDIRAQAAQAAPGDTIGKTVGNA